MAKCPANEFLASFCYSKSNAFNYYKVKSVYDKSTTVSHTRSVRWLILRSAAVFLMRSPHTVIYLISDNYHRTSCLLIKNEP